MRTGRIGLRFADRETFGRFCVQLTESNIKFALAAPLTIVLPETVYNSLKRESKLPADITVGEVTRGNKRRAMPSVGNTEAKLWKYAKAN